MIAYVVIAPLFGAVAQIPTTTPTDIHTKFMNTTS